MNETPRIEMSMPAFRRLTSSNTAKGVVHQTEARSGDVQREAKQAPSYFSDADIDQLLKDLGLKPSENLRLAARFLMRHHFTLSAPMLNMADQLLPQGPWLEHGPSETLIVAMSRLPMEDVPSAFYVLGNALGRSSQNFWAWIQQMVVQLEELESKWLVDPKMVLSKKGLAEAIGEEVKQWRQMLQSPYQQMASLTQRWTLLQELSRLKHWMSVTKKVVRAAKLTSDDGWEEHVDQVIEKTTFGIESLEADDILSKEDVMGHFLEKGLSVGLSLWGEQAHGPCRVWHESSGEHDIDPEAPWVFRLQWNFEEKGHLDCRISIKDDRCHLKWEGHAPDVLKAIEQGDEHLKEQLKTLGFMLASSTAHLLNSERFDPESEVHGVTSGPLRHIDSNA
jgi:hypothetical protein